MATVQKTLKMDSSLAEQIESYSSAVGVDFSEGLRRLVRKGLSTNPSYPFSAPTGPQIGLEEVIQEIHRSTATITQEFQESLDQYFLYASLGKEDNDG